jgi:hypothetical protein
MKLPNGHRADLGDKLERYVLNTQHHRGKHKAHVFESVLGITLKNVRILKDALLRAAATSDACESRGHQGHGVQYVLRFEMTTTAGSAVIVSAWIIRDQEDFPRLTTCYIL